jgi:hypothetical protein
MCEMRGAGMTFRAIAARYRVTFQAVQQAVSRAVDRNPELAACPLKVEGASAKPPRPLRFKACMHRWLRWAGFRYCWSCKIVLEEREFSPKGRICRICNNMKARELYRRSSVVRENIRRHNRMNGKMYNQRYIEKLKRENPERLREIRRQAYLNRKAKALAAAAGAAPPLAVSAAQ